LKPASAVTFDVGQVLASFEPRALASKLDERGGGADVAALEAAMPEGWEAYGAVLKAGGSAEASWKAFITTLLERAGATPAPDEALLGWLYADNVRRNLWRRPVEGMIALARSLRLAGVGVAAVSNSEGGLLELMRQLGCADDFVAIADSAVLGHEKPGPEIFRWAFERLGVRGDEVVHIGDSWAADVEGALGVGARAIWFPAADARVTDRARVWPARHVDDVKAGLAAYGLPRHALDAPLHAPRA
jgi:HAD superfamily hydrolase (TIGR01509 family)